MEHLRCYGEVRVPLAGSNMDAVGGVWMPEVERVVVCVGVVVSYEGCEVGVMV